MSIISPDWPLTFTKGSHVVFALQETRKYKVISIDNYHNSFPAALTRLNGIAQAALPENATEQEKDSAVVDSYKCDLTDAAQIRAVFEKYGKGGIWGVIHVAVGVPSRSSVTIDPHHVRRTNRSESRPKFPSPTTSTMSLRPYPSFKPCLNSIVFASYIPRRPPSTGRHRPYPSPNRHASRPTVLMVNRK